jgi:hypothetical protein
MINIWFFIALIVGFIGRMVSGVFISLAAGLVSGVLLSEVWKFALYYGFGWVRK